MILTGHISDDDHGSDLGFLLELRGFNSLTPSMRTQCSTSQIAQVTAPAQVSGLRTATITASEAA